MHRFWLVATVLIVQLLSVLVGSAIGWWLSLWWSGALITAVVMTLLVSNALLGWVVWWRAGAAVYRLGCLWLVLLLYVLYSALPVSILAWWQYSVATNNAIWTRWMTDAVVEGVMSLNAPVLLRAVGLLLWLGLLAWSLFNAYVPIVRRLQLSIGKPLATPLRLAMVSDLHLGQLVGNTQLRKLTDIVTQERAQVVLMPGDLLDDDTRAFDQHNMADALATLVQTVPYGVIATLGNHDLYHHEQPISQALRQAGVCLLNDQAKQVAGVWIMGRPDDLKAQRLPTAQLLTQIDTRLPVLLLDHRPSSIVTHSQLPIDLQVSGHTHNGQIAPANWIVKSLYPLAYGHKQIGHSHFVVSSGYGFWGIPLRLGSRAEVWLIELTGTTAAAQNA